MGMVVRNGRGVEEECGLVVVGILRDERGVLVIMYLWRLWNEMGGELGGGRVIWGEEVGFG